MDRISALRNIEEALSAYEEGEMALPALEREVRGILRTYATSFDEAAGVYRVSGGDRVDGLVVVAGSRREARERVAELVDPDPGPVEVERIE
jgi:hypothetical protein